MAMERLSFVFSRQFAERYGVAHNEIMQLLWLRRAAACGLTSSCYKLGRSFWDGECGLPAKSLGAANYWLKRAVAVGTIDLYTKMATKRLDGTYDADGLSILHEARKQLPTEQLRQQEQVAVALSVY